MSEHGHHIIKLSTLWNVAASLTVLTVLTVVVSNLGLPSPLDILSALVIALTKAYLVAAFFMGLRWDNKFNSVLLIGAVFFFLLMVCITMLDTMYRVEVVPSF